MPDFKAYIRENLGPLGMPGAREAEIIEELADEFEDSYERALRNGLSAEEAWQQVLTNARPWRTLADELRAEVREHEPVDVKTRNSIWVRLTDGVRQDLRYALRQMMQSPGLTAIAVLTLALGIGANTAIFSVTNAIVLRHLPVHEPDQLMFLGTVRAEGTTQYLANGQAFSYPFFRAFQRRNEVFADVAAVNSLEFTTHGLVGPGSEMEKLNVELVSGSYFGTVGVNSVLGRTLNETDDQKPGQHPVVVASYSWWHRRFGGDPTAIGNSVKIGSTLYSIVGIAPPGFFGLTVGRSPDLWIPLAMEKEIAPGRNGLSSVRFLSLHLIGRKKAGVTSEQAQANTDVVARQILLDHASDQKDPEEMEHLQRFSIRLTPAGTGRSRLRLQFSAALSMLMLVVGVVLIIACANIANLLLVRANVRQREIAIRMSIGAKRSRLIRQLLLESGLLAFTGAVIGLTMSWFGSHLLVQMVSRNSEELALRVEPDLLVLGFTLVVTMATVFLFGVAPAFYATRLNMFSALKEGRGLVSLPNRGRVSRLIVVAQVALSLILLVGAGLFLRSLTNLMSVETGFDKQNVILMTVDSSSAGYEQDARLESMMERVEERVSSIPGIRAASFAMNVFDGGGWSQTGIVIPGRTPSDSDPKVDLNLVGPQYFEAMKIPIVLGRPLSLHDSAESPKVAVINETMAHVYFAGESPIGRTFSLEDEPDLQNIEVVGVMKDAKYMQLEEKQMPAAFFPHAQRHRILDTFAARYTGDFQPLVSEIRSAFREIDPNLPLSDVTTLERAVDTAAVDKRVVAQLTTGFALLASFLAFIGIYGVMSYGITKRTNEFGIRMALGATSRHVQWVVLRETLYLVISGIALGLLLAGISKSVVESLLFGLKSSDPFTIVLAVTAMIVVSLLAGYIPARRATRIDPTVALRHE